MHDGGRASVPQLACSNSAWRLAGANVAFFAGTHGLCNDLQTERFNCKDRAGRH